MMKMTPNTGPRARDLDGILQICGGTQKGVKIAKGVRNFRVHDDDFHTWLQALV